MAMGSIPIWLGVLVLGWGVILLLKWVVAPIRTHGTFRLAARAGWQPTSPEQLTPEMCDYVAQTIQDFRAQGFEAVANVHTDSAYPGVRGVHILLVSRATNDTAAVLMAHAGLNRSLVHAIRSDFPDGSRVLTGANPGIGFVPVNRAHNVANFPWATGPAALCEAHRRRLVRAGKANSRRVAPAPGAELKWLDAEWERELGWQETCGYMRLDPQSGDYRATWRGAFIMTWKLTEPLRRWRIRRRDRRYRRLWNVLGMNTWQPARSGAAAPDSALMAASAASHPPEALPCPAIATLHYEPSLREGEIRQEWTDSALVVRVVVATRGQFLARQSGRLFGIALYTAVLGCSLYVAYRLNQPWPAAAPVFWQTSRAFCVTAACMALLLFVDVACLL